MLSSGVEEEAREKFCWIWKGSEGKKGGRKMIEGWSSRTGQGAISR